MSRRLLALATIGILGLAASSQAAVIFTDNFEGYADTTAMRAAGAWGDLSANTITAGTLATDATPTKYMSYAAPGTSTGGGPAYKHVLSSGVTPSASQSVVFSFDFLDDGGGNERYAAGLRTKQGGTGTEFVEMGKYNSATNPETGLAFSGYAIRTVNLAGTPAGNAGWVSFVNTPNVAAGWHRMTATFTAASAVFTLDMDRDGTPEATRTITTANGGVTYDLIRLGGPSDLGSPAGSTIGFDNISLTTVAVPEPASLSLLGLGALGLVARRRRA